MPNKLKYKNDPTDEFETVKEFTASEEFYNSEVEVPEHAEVYITYLELKIKAMKEATKILHDEMEQTHQTYFINKLWKIFKI
jgi:hypothetical protein